MSQPEKDRQAEALRHLLDEAACRELVLRAATLADAGQSDALAALFTADARLVRPNGMELKGREAIARAYRDRPAHRITVHLVCGTLFDEVGRDHASATTRVLLWAGDLRADSSLQGRAAEGRQIIGRFVDRFVRDEEGWRIDRREACFDLHTPDIPSQGRSPAMGTLSKPYLDIPGTTVFDADMARRGYELNRFCMSLMQADNRARFKADEDACLAAWPMTPEQRAAVRARDYNACIALGGNIFFLVKIGAADGISAQELVSSMSGMSEEEYRRMMLAGGRPPDGNLRLGEDGNARRPHGAA